MTEKTAETLKLVADTTLEKPFELTININHGGFIERLLQKWGIRPKKRVFNLRPITLGNLIRISKLLLEIDENLLNTPKIQQALYVALEKHGDLIAEVIAIALVNSKAGPSSTEIALIRNELSAVELKTVLSVVLNRMNVESFFHSIISIRGLNVLESEPRKEPKKKVSP